MNWLSHSRSNHYPRVTFWPCSDGLRGVSWCSSSHSRGLTAVTQLVVAMVTGFVVAVISRAKFQVSKCVCGYRSQVAWLVWLPTMDNARGDRMPGFIAHQLFLGDVLMMSSWVMTHSIIIFLRLQQRVSVNHFRLAECFSEILIYELHQTFLFIYFLLYRFGSMVEQIRLWMVLWNRYALMCRQLRVKLKWMFY